MKGYIYKCTCNITNKCYIGQTTLDYNKRWNDHIKESFNEKLPGYNYHFHRAIRKYGIDNFKWEIVETIECINSENIYEILNNLEKKYILKYNSYKNGYNSTEGGDSSKKEQKAIISYSEDGDIIRKFDNVNEASTFYNISKNIIWMICGRFQYYTINNSNKIIFRYEGDDYTESEISKVKSINYDKLIDVYNLEGILINHFNSVTEAASNYNIKNNRIITCCNRKSSFVLIDYNKYIFRYSGDICTKEDLIKAINIKSSPKISVIAIDLVTNKILGTFSTMSEGAKLFNTKSNKISEVCSGKRKSSGKYNGHPIKWIYNKPTK